MQSLCSSLMLHYYNVALCVVRALITILPTNVQVKNQLVSSHMLHNCSIREKKQKCCAVVITYHNNHCGRKVTCRKPNWLLQTWKRQHYGNEIANNSFVRETCSHVVVTANTVIVVKFCL